MFSAKLFLRHVCYFIVFFLIWQYLFCRFDGFCGISFSVCIVYLLFYVILPFVFSYFSLSLVDVLQLGIWREANSLVDPSLRKLIPNLLHLQLESRAPSALQKYRSGWLKWRQWAASKIGIQAILAKPLHVMLFLSKLTVISVSNNTGILRGYLP